MGKTTNQRVEGLPLRVWQGEDGTFPKPGELIEIRDHSKLTLNDRRVLNLLLVNAWERITESVEHVIKKSVLRGNRPGNERLSESIERLMKTLVEIQVVRDGKPARRLTHMLGDTDEHRDEAGSLYYSFPPSMIEIISQSDHYARLQAQAMVDLRSKYAMALYEMIQKRAGLQHKFREGFSIDEIRNILGVPEGKMTKWTDLYRFAIDPAQKQVQPVASCYVRIEPIKNGRFITGARMIWTPKDEAGLMLKYDKIEEKKAKFKKESRQRELGV